MRRSGSGARRPLINSSSSQEDTVFQTGIYSFSGIQLFGRLTPISHRARRHPGHRTERRHFQRQAPHPAQKTRTARSLARRIPGRSSLQHLEEIPNRDRANSKIGQKPNGQIGSLNSDPPGPPFNFSDVPIDNRTVLHPCQSLPTLLLSAFSISMNRKSKSRR